LPIVLTLGFCGVHRAQAVADSEEGLEKYLSRTAFLSWSKRMPAVAQTMRSLLALQSGGGGDGGCGTAGGTTAGSRPRGSNNAGSSGSSSGGAAAGGGSAVAGGSTLLSQARVPQPVVPQLISLAGVNLDACLMRREWAWALATSGFLSLERCREWRLLFTTAKHGQSFSTFMGRCACRGRRLK